MLGGRVADLNQRFISASSLLHSAFSFQMQHVAAVYKLASSLVPCCRWLTLVYFIWIRLEDEGVRPNRSHEKAAPKVAISMRYSSYLSLTSDCEGKILSTVDIVAERL